MAFAAAAMALAFVMMGAHGIGVIDKLPLCQRRSLNVRHARNARVNGDPRLGKGAARAAANTAADQRFNA